MTLVDTNVLLDVFNADAQWMAWSARQLHLARSNQGLAINMVVYAELAGHPHCPKHLDAVLQSLEVEVLNVNRTSAKLAGKAFYQYRQRGGQKSGVLPDFFIGAQAVSEGYRLLTRDAGRYKTYFPKIKLISP